MKKKLKIKISMTPTWLSIYPLYCEWIDTGTKDQKALLKDELKRLCVAMDETRARMKSVLTIKKAELRLLKLRKGGTR